MKLFLPKYKWKVIFAYLFIVYLRAIIFYLHNAILLILAIHSNNKITYTQKTNTQINMKNYSTL